MENEQPRDQSMLGNLANALQEFPRREQTLPRVTDRDILRAMIGKPFSTSQDQPVALRKAG